MSRQVVCDLCEIECTGKHARVYLEAEPAEFGDLPDELDVCPTCFDSLVDKLKGKKP